jgi:hypothetical protein
VKNSTLHASKKGDFSVIMCVLSLWNNNHHTCFTFCDIYTNIVTEVNAFDFTRTHLPLTHVINSPATNCWILLHISVGVTWGSHCRFVVVFSTMRTHRCLTFEKKQTVASASGVAFGFSSTIT